MPNNAHLSLFSGIGGLDLAAEWAGFRTVAFVERDKYCQRVLAKHWPGVPIYSDVAEVSVSVGCVDAGKMGEFRDAGAGNGKRFHRPALISGGFPCQPHSVAGKRKGSGDERDLWDECARITGEFKPRWAVFENVPGLLSSEGGSFFARVLGDLASLGYRVGWGVWGANDVGALHRRDRVFIVAHAGCEGVHERWERRDAEELRVQPAGVEWDGFPEGRRRKGEDVANSGCGRQPGPGESFHAINTTEGAAWEATKPIDGGGRQIWSIEPQVGRVATGVPRRVDRLRALGNAVVPQQAYPIFKAIAEIEGINA